VFDTARRRRLAPRPRQCEEPGREARGCRTARAREEFVVIRPLYDWTMAQAEKPYASRFLAFISFLESSVFPIPPDVLLIPMVLGARARAWYYATLCTVASVVGGLAGYLIGAYLFELIGQPILQFYDYVEEFNDFEQIYQQWGLWIVFLAGFTPFPYKVVTIASGVAGLDLATFMIASAVARGGRFFLVAGLLWQFGPPIRGFIERNLGWLTVLFFVLLFGGFLVIRYL
jgi:membrane protein YqaA with SNARE-associated domain